MPVEPFTAAAATVALLLASKAGESVGSEAGRAVWDRLARVRTRSVADPQAGPALAAAEVAPEDQEVLSRLTGCLIALAERDQALHEEIQELAGQLGKESGQGNQYAQKIVNSTIGVVNTENFRIG